MSGADLSGLNAGYVAQMLEAYLDAPASVPDEWRELFEHDPAAFPARCPASPACSARRRRTVPPRRAGSHPLSRRARAACALAEPSGTGRAAPPARCAAGDRPSPAPHRLPAADGCRERAEAPADGAAAPVDETLLGGVAAAMALVKAYRMHGHLAARLDPLGSEPMGDPALDESRLVPSLTPELQARIPASLLRLYVDGETLLEALPLLRAVYTGSIAYEIEHISDHAERVWLRQAIESGRFRQPLEPEERQRAPPPALPGRGVRAVPAPVVPRPEAVLARGSRVARADARRDDRARGRRRRPRGRDRDGPPGPAQRPRPHRRALVPVDPARVRGRALDRRARRRPGGRHRRRQVPPARLRHARHRRPARSTSRSCRTRATSRPPTRSSRAARAPSRPTAPSGAGIHDPSVALPVLIHGDAAFPGQGVVAETLNLQSLEGYATGGTLHLITNNQVGYTTDPTESRSTRYSSDLAKGFDVPIVHVNADDPEAALSRRSARARLSRRVRPRLRDRPRRLPALRPQRAGRRVVHAAADGREDPATADGARRLRRAAHRGGRDHGREAEGIVAEVTATLRSAHEQLRTAIGHTTPPPARPGAGPRP